MGARVNLEGTQPSDAVNRRISIVVLSEHAAEQMRDQGEAGAANPETILDGMDDTRRDGLSPTQGADSLMRNALPQVYERTTGGGEGQDQPSP